MNSKMLLRYMQCPSPPSLTLSHSWLHRGAQCMVAFRGLALLVPISPSGSVLHCFTSDASAAPGAKRAMPCYQLVLLCAVSSAWNIMLSIFLHRNLYSPFKIQIKCHTREHTSPTLPGNLFLLSLFSQSILFLPLLSVLIAMYCNNLLACLFY